jgi:hypothetical protein
VAHGLDEWNMWPGQCRYIRIVETHLVRLYAALMRSPSAARVRHVLDSTPAGGAPHLPTD